jgi:hypothetical protein
MKQPLRSAYLILGVISMLSFFGCSGGFKYEKYVSKNPELNFFIDHITGWSAHEQIGSFNSFSQVGFYEPVMSGKSLRAMMIVTVMDKSRLGFAPGTLDVMLGDLIKKRMLFNSTKVVSKTSMTLSGQAAYRIEFSYRGLDSFENRQAKLVPMKERVVIFERNGKFYSVRYENLADDFNKYSRAFDHIVRSIKFK